jgi:RNA polymerase sigma factor (sigma-70 family)
MSELTSIRRTDLDELTRAAARGDEAAWTDLVMRLDAVLHAVAGRYRLGADIDDVVQTTWLRALEHVDRMHDPGAIAGWLVATTRREAMRTLQRGVREVVTDDVAETMDADPGAPDAIAIDGERRAVVRAAVARLPRRQRRVMTSMLASPTLTYRHVAQEADISLGSIGPTRDRAIARLRKDPQLAQAVQRCP